MKRVLITGGSSGIGLALVNGYLAAGWQVIACGRSRDKLDKVLTESDQLSFCITDISDRDHALAKLGTYEELDLVILNAGSCEYIDHPKQFDSELFARVMATNVLGTGYCLEALLPNIVAGGQLAIVSSIASQLPLPRSEAYGASKAATDYLARNLAIDLAPHNIDVSLIRPGFVATPLTAKNDFPMPFIVSADDACRIIMSGLAKRKGEISFPRRLIWTMKLLSCLPHRAWKVLAQRFILPVKYN